MRTGNLPAILFGGAASACVAYGIIFEQFNLKLRVLELDFVNLPPAFDGYTILHLSDLHLTQFGLLENRLVKLVSDLEADLCVVTGDITQTPDAVKAFRRICSSIQRREPTIYAVLGNSEHKPWADTDLIVRVFSRENVRFLINSSQMIYRESDRVVLVGVDDAYSRLDDVDLAFSGVDPNDFVIFLTHCPSTTPRAIDGGADLILAGHTHGGQIRLPFVGLLWAHMRANKRLNDGLYRPDRLAQILGRDCGSSVLFVNRGVGTSKLHVRFLCPPEVAYIRLRRPV
ncbi:MAG: metallophosphoesterase [Armatimonadota bacterium]